MKKNMLFTKRFAALAAAGLLGMCCLSTGCQATPASAAVVNKKAGVPEEALIAAPDASDPQAPAAAAGAAEYKASEHWQDTIKKSPRYTVKADVDILVPDAPAYPVVKVGPLDMTQETADRLIEHFAPGAEFYRTAQQKTKAEWEQDILNLKETLAMDKEAGDEDAVQADQATIDEWTQMYEKAPESAERVPATTEYTYAYDYVAGTEDHEMGPNFIGISTIADDGSVKQFDARRAIADDPSQFPYFSYMNANYQTEEIDLSNKEMYESHRLAVEELEEPLRSEELANVDTGLANIEKRTAMYNQSPVDLAAAEKLAVDTLADLGIQDAQIVSSSKAVLEPYTGEYVEEADQDFSEHGAYFEFRRQNGGIPCHTPDMQMAPASADQYSAPIAPEKGSILLDKNGTVRWFQWESPSEVIEEVAADSKLLSLDEIKERAAEEFYRTELLTSGEYLENHDMTCEIDDMRLVMTYVNAKDDEKNALVIPAWHIKSLTRSKDENDETFVVNCGEVMLSALDGSAVLMPGALQMSGSEAA